jgi:hypothetical protein
MTTHTGTGGPAHRRQTLRRGHRRAGAGLRGRARRAAAAPPRTRRPWERRHGELLKRQIPVPQGTPATEHGNEWQRGGEEIG